MTQKLLNISDKIEPSSLDVLTIVTKIAREINIETFVIGATAIDIIFAQIYGFKIHRITNDIDFSVRVKNWEDYSKLVKKLEEQGFSSSVIEHRFNYKSIPSIDIIPFGAISIPKLSIKWQGKDSKEMSVMGYEECYNDSLLVRINESPPFDVRISSPRGSVLLKLISWEDAFPSRTRDATDILYIMQHYIEAGNEVRLYDEHIDLVNDDFDFELTGATLLGRDIAEFAFPNTLLHISNLIANELVDPPNSNFIKDMSKGDFQSFDHDRNFEHCLQLLKNFHDGLIHPKE